MIGQVKLGWKGRGGNNCCWKNQGHIENDLALPMELFARRIPCQLASKSRIPREDSKRMEVPAVWI